MVNFGYELLAVSPVGSEEIDVPASGQIGLTPAKARPRTHEFQYPYQHQNDTHITRSPALRPHMSFPMIFDAASTPGHSDKPFHATVDLIDSPGDPRYFSIMFSSKTTYSWPSRLDGVDPLRDPSPSIRLKFFSRTLVRVGDREPQFDGRIGVMLLPHSQTHAKDMLTILELGNDGFIYPCTLCSASGRMAYGIEGIGVFVVDYLSSLLT